MNSSGARCGAIRLHAIWPSDDHEWFVHGDFEQHVQLAVLVPGRPAGYGYGRLQLPAPGLRSSPRAMDDDGPNGIRGRVDSDFYRFVGNDPTDGMDPSGLDGVRLFGRRFVTPWSDEADFSIGANLRNVGAAGRQTAIVGTFTGVGSGAVSGYRRRSCWHVLIEPGGGTLVGGVGGVIGGFTGGVAGFLHAAFADGPEEAVSAELSGVE